MQVALGAVYAWSVFADPLAQAYGGASATAVNSTFSITIFTLGFAAFVGGLWMGNSGPRIVALTAGALYGVGIFLAGFASNSLVLLYLTYGFVAGAGIGLGYIVPVATLIKWFPDKRGFITGIAVAGFGGGAFVTALVAKGLVSSFGPFRTFTILGILYLVMVVGAALFLNVTAGIAIITVASPMAVALAGVSATVAAGLVRIISVGNASGRFLWAWLSDTIGRKWVFFVMFILQAALFILLPFLGAASYLLLAVISFIIVSCYGGGFGTMPAFAADYFGPANVGQIYGLMLTAWSFGGVLGPLLISRVIDVTGSYTLAFYILAAIMVGSAVVAFIVSPPTRGSEATAPQAEEARA